MITLSVKDKQKDKKTEKNTNNTKIKYILLHHLTLFRVVFWYNEDGCGGIKHVPQAEFEKS